MGSGGDPLKDVTTRASVVQGTIAIEGAIAAVDGSDHQQVPVGEQVELGAVIVGPERVKLDSENLRGQIDARGGVRFYDVLSVEGIIGLGIDSTELRLRGAGVDTSDENLVAGFLAGGRATVRPIPLFDVYVQYVANLAESWTIIQDTMLDARERAEPHAQHLALQAIAGGDTRRASAGSPTGSSTFAGRRPGRA